MTISQAIERLELLKARHGDVQVQADCPYCGRVFTCGAVIVAPETVKLREAFQK